MSLYGYQLVRVSQSNRNLFWLRVVSLFSLQRNWTNSKVSTSLACSTSYQLVKCYSFLSLLFSFLSIVNRWQWLRSLTKLWRRKQRWQELDLKVYALVWEFVCRPGTPGLITLVGWFHHPAESCSYNQIQFGHLWKPVPRLLPAENVNVETLFSLLMLIWIQLVWTVLWRRTVYLTAAPKRTSMTCKVYSTFADDYFISLYSCHTTSN